MLVLLALPMCLITWIKHCWKASSALRRQYAICSALVLFTTVAPSGSMERANGTALTEAPWPREEVLQECYLDRFFFFKAEQAAAGEALDSDASSSSEYQSS